MTGRWLISGSAAILLVFSILFCKGIVQGEPSKKLRHLDVTVKRDYRWSDKSEGLVLNVRLSSLNFPEGGSIPEKLTLVTSLSGALGHDWIVERIDGFTLAGDKEFEMTPGPFLDGESKNPKVAELRYLGPDFSYSFDIYLKRVRADGILTAEARRLVGEKAVSVIVRRPE